MYNSKPILSTKKFIFLPPLAIGAGSVGQLLHWGMIAWLGEWGDGEMGKWGGELFGPRLLIRRSCNIPWNLEYLTWYFFHTRYLRFFPMTND